MDASRDETSDFGDLEAAVWTDTVGYISISDKCEKAVTRARGMFKWEISRSRFSGEVSDER